MLSIICFILFSFKYSSNVFLLYLFAFLIKFFFLSLSPDFSLAQTKFFFKNPSSNLAFILYPLSGSMTQRRQISAYLGMALLIPLKSDPSLKLLSTFIQRQK